jgi:hypothetical protein
MLTAGPAGIRLPQPGAIADDPEKVETDAANARRPQSPQGIRR